MSSYESAPSNESYEEKLFAAKEALAETLNDIDEGFNPPVYIGSNKAPSGQELHASIDHFDDLIVEYSELLGQRAAENMQLDVELGKFRTVSEELQHHIHELSKKPTLTENDISLWKELCEKFNEILQNPMGDSAPYESTQQ